MAKRTAPARTLGFAESGYDRLVPPGQRWQNLSRRSLQKVSNLVSTEALSFAQPPFFGGGKWIKLVV
jgi:hypothetical protein